MFYTYILYSESIDRYYVGYSCDPLVRLEKRHNQGLVKSTKAGIPYKIMATKAFDSKLEAMQEELRLKKGKNRRYLEWLIQDNW